jgi:hypothetical protein
MNLQISQLKFVIHEDLLYILYLQANALYRAKIEVDSRGMATLSECQLLYQQGKFFSYVDPSKYLA